MEREWNKVPQLSLPCLLALPQGRRRSTVLRGQPHDPPFSDRVALNAWRLLPSPAPETRNATQAGER